MRTRSTMLAMSMALALTQAGIASAQESDAEQQARLNAFTATIVEEVIVPRFAELERAASQLETDLQQFCTAPSETLLSKVGETFQATALAWARVMTMPIDPLNREFRRERFLFWPDPRGVTLRQVQPVVIDRDPTAIELSTLQEKSVALQGLGALEFLLYGGGAETMLTGSDEGTYRCAYAIQSVRICTASPPTLRQKPARMAPSRRQS